MNCNFRVGQKVVCVNASNNDRLSEGRVYTVKKVYGFLLPVPNLGMEGDYGVLLHEAEPPNSRGFAASRFRPVVERKTDISVFKAMLTGTKAKVRA